jgi:AmmeMemoRadiSam system protein A
MPQGPRTAADVLIEVAPLRIVLIRRRNPPLGWAIPGGFIEVGECAELAAAREAFEETGLDVELTELFHVYSDPARDPRGHTLSIVYIGRASGDPLAGDDAADARAFAEDEIPPDLAFDHRRILSDYFRYRRHGQRPPPRPRGRHRLTSDERRRLLRVAREALAAACDGRAPDETHPPLGPLAEPCGAFVSLHREGELRGCIGTFVQDRPLEWVVRDMAVAAGFEDPRFCPLQSVELGSLDIEISVLSELCRTTADAVVPGFHGVSVALGSAKGVFLPRVAVEAGWDRETLLAEACRKAGLEPDAWRRPQAEISVFTAEAFGESDLAEPE